MSTSWGAPAASLNVAGHRLSTSFDGEAALAGHPAVASVRSSGCTTTSGPVPRALVVLKAGIDKAMEVTGSVGARRPGRSEVGAVAALRQVDIVAALPKTRSGKILPQDDREIADGATVVPATMGTGVLDASRRSCAALSAALSG